jgi:hypothetical protein
MAKASRKGVQFISPEDPLIDEEDPFFKFSKKHVDSCLKTYEYLEFEKKCKSLYTCCKLNDPTKDKKDLLSKVVVFCKENLTQAISKLSSSVNARTNWTMCRKLIELCMGVMKLNNHYKWTVTDITDIKIDKLLFVLSDDFFKSDKIISMRDLISLDDLDLIVSRPSSMAMYRLLDVCVLVMNVQAKQFVNLELKNQALTTLYQAVSIRKLSMHSKFDFFQIVHYALNFVDILESSLQKDRAITLLQSIMMVCEHLINNMSLDMVVSYEQVDFFKSHFCFVSDRWQDPDIEDKLPSIDIDSTEAQISSHLSSILKCRLTMAYKIVGEMLHEKGLYQDAYLAMNYHNVLYVELVGDAPIQEYKRLILQIEGKKQLDTLESGQNPAGTKEKNKSNPKPKRESLSEDPYFKKPWRMIKSEIDNRDGCLLTHYTNEHGWQVIFDYVRRFEAIILVVNVADFIIDGTYWIDLDDVKIAYSNSAEIGEIKFIENNQKAITE